MDINTAFYIVVGLYAISVQMRLGRLNRNVEDVHARVDDVTNRLDDVEEQLDISEQ